MRLVPSAPIASAAGAVSSGAAAQSAMPWPMQPATPAGWIEQCRWRVALQDRDGVAGGRGDVDVAPAGGDRERRGLRERAAVVQPRPPARRMQPVGPGCCESAPVVRVALQDGDRVGVLGGRVERRAVGRDRERVDARERAAARHAPASSPPRMQACLPPSWSSAPPVGSIENDGDGVGVAAGDVEAAAVGRDRERGRAEQADARGAAAEAAGPHASGGALELRQRAGREVTRERRSRSSRSTRRRRDGARRARARSARRRSGRARGRSRRPRTRRSRARRRACVSCAGLGIALERGDRRAAADVDVEPVGADRDGARALEARCARAPAGGRLRRSRAAGWRSGVERARRARRGVRAGERHEGREQRPGEKSTYMKLHAARFDAQLPESCRGRRAPRRIAPARASP